MKLFNDNVVKFDSSKMNLNFLLLNFTDYKGGTPKIIKTDSDFYNDVFVYKTGSYKGDTAVLECFVRSEDIKRRIVNYFKECNQIELPKENGWYHEYFLDGAFEYSYHFNGIKIRVPVFLSGYKYKIENSSFSIKRAGESISIHNPYYDTATPIYTIHGSGDVSFSVNDKVCLLKSCVISYSLDTRDGKQNVLNASKMPKNITSEYNGVLPLLVHGDNVIRLNIGTRLDIKVNWRES